MLVKKPEIYYVYTVDVALSKTKREWSILNRGKNKNISRAEEISYTFSVCTDGNMMEQRPVVVGSGPAGLFCAYLLAKYGYRPILIEQGAPAKERRKAVETFWETGVLDIRTNVQFGEGGAGTFSDGKLNTLVKDPSGRNHEVLKRFVQAGAPEEIIYQQKPHLGTDVLVGVVEKLRHEIEEMGGSFRFRSKVTNLFFENDQLKEVEVNWGNSGFRQRYVCWLLDTVPEIPSLCLKRRASIWSRNPLPWVCVWNIHSP